MKFRVELNCFRGEKFSGVFSVENLCGVFWGFLSFLGKSAEDFRVKTVV